MSRVACESRSPRKTARRMCVRGVALLVCLVSLAMPVAAQRDARVLHQNLADMVTEAQTVILGRVVSVKAEPHPEFANLKTIVVTLDVQEVLKGQAPRLFTFRQFVSHPLDYKEKLGYAGDQDVLLMLTKPSQYGLSSPAGLEQGRFRIQTDANGNRTVVNGVNNAGLFIRIAKSAPKLDAQLAGLPARQLLTQHRSGPIPLDEFKSIIQTLVANPQ